jgi:exopolysaccharide biosynthesis protein
MAIAGFSGLLREGKVLPKAGGPLHPRTALGLDAAGRRLTLVVVDGRQAGFSEGMSEYELAELLAGLGCQDALNLDGGGSSVMLMADPEGKLQIVNRPSESSGPRSVPVMIGVRKSLKNPMTASDISGCGLRSNKPFSAGASINLNPLALT